MAAAGTSSSCAGWLTPRRATGDADGEGEGLGDGAPVAVAGGARIEVATGEMTATGMFPVSAGWEERVQAASQSASAQNVHHVPRVPATKRPPQRVTHMGPPVEYRKEPAQPQGTSGGW